MNEFLCKHGFHGDGCPQCQNLMNYKKMWEELKEGMEKFLECEESQVLKDYLYYMNQLEKEGE